MRSFLFFISFALFIAFYSSCTCKSNVVCDQGLLYFSTIKFSKADLDSAVFYSYKADSKFDSLIDSVKDLSGGYFLGTRSDTDSFLLPASVDVGTDCKLIFPTRKLTLNITNVQPIGATTQEIKHACNDPVSCKNDVTFTVNGQPSSGSKYLGLYAYYINK